MTLPLLRASPLVLLLVAQARKVFTMRNALFALALVLSAPALADETDWLSPGVSGIRSSVQAQGAILDLMRASAVNVKACTGSQMFCASGSAQATTGSITSGSTSLTVASAIDFAVGQGISVAQAGVANALLVAKITAISGTTITLDTAASVTRSSVAVVHDDTAAIQAAINSSPAPGGLVLVPPGYFNVSGAGLTLRSGTWFRGAGAGIGPDDAANNVSTIDATRMTTGNAITAVGKGLHVEGFYLKGVTAGYQGVYGISMGGSMNLLRDIYVAGFYTGVTVGAATSRSQLQMVETNLQYAWGLRLDGVNDFSVMDCYFLNGNAANAVNGGGTVFVNGGYDISFRLQVIDESGRGGAGIKIVAATRVLIEGPLIYATQVNGASGTAISVDSASSEVTIRNVHTKMFGAYDAQYQISLAGTNHRLENVVTEPRTGGDISDTSTGTVYWNVNGIYKMPNLRTTAPAAGSKELWADPDDSYRVKWAN